MLKIKYQETGKLIPYINNSRTHSEQQVQQVAASIREFGFTNPILVDKENTIIAGHGRLQAAQMLGLDKVPTIVLADLTDTQRRAYVIADNKLALNASWDDELLKIELMELDGFDYSLMGFERDELDLILNGWDSDIKLDDEPEEDNWFALRYKIQKHDEAAAKEVVTNALQAAGIDYED